MTNPVVRASALHEHRSLELEADSGLDHLRDLPELALPEHMVNAVRRVNLNGVVAGAFSPNIGFGSFYLTYALRLGCSLPCLRFLLFSHSNSCHGGRPLIHMASKKESPG